MTDEKDTNVETFEKPEKPPEVAIHHDGKAVVTAAPDSDLGKAITIISREMSGLRRKLDAVLGDWLRVCDSIGLASEAEGLGVKVATADEVIERMKTVTLRADRTGYLEAIREELNATCSCTGDIPRTDCVACHVISRAIRKQALKQ